MLWFLSETLRFFTVVYRKALQPEMRRLLFSMCGKRARSPPVNPHQRCVLLVGQCLETTAQPGSFPAIIQPARSSPSSDCPPTSMPDTVDGEGKPRHDP